MAGVFRECKLSWKGEEYVFTPSMKLLRLIERGDEGGPVCLLNLMNEVNSGKPQISFIAWLVHLVMTYAGAKATEEEVYQAMFTQQEGAAALYNVVIEAISPTVADEKKTEAPDE